MCRRVSAFIGFVKFYWKCFIIVACCAKSEPSMLFVCYLITLVSCESQWLSSKAVKPVKTQWKLKFTSSFTFSKAAQGVGVFVLLQDVVSPFVNKPFFSFFGGWAGLRWPTAFLCSFHLPTPVEKLILIGPVSQTRLEPSPRIKCTLTTFYKDLACSGLNQDDCKM